MSKKIHVGHIVRNYVRLTETFIQSYLTHAQDHLPCVLTDVLFCNRSVNTPCIYLIDQHQLTTMSPFARCRFLSALNYPNCYEQTVVEKKIDLLHAHFGAMGYRTLELKRNANLPLVVSFYGVDASHMLRVPRWQKAFQRVFDQADMIIALGVDMANRLSGAGCPVRKIQIVHLGVDLGAIPFRVRVSPLKTDPIVLLYCGRLVHKKGIFDALHAFAQVAMDWPQLVFRIVGDGVLKPEVIRQIEALGIGGRVVVVGALSHDRVIQEMQNAHVFILPSKMPRNGDMEGTPTVLLEAQASGLPVLSTYHADIPEVVLDGESGFLVPEGDVEALGDKLQILLAQPECWAAFGRAGYEHIKKHYHIRQEVSILEHLYQELM